MSATDLPECIDSVERLEEMLSRPHPETVELMKRLEGDIVVLGAGGKIGISLSRTAARAIQEAGVNKRVIAVSRFGDTSIREFLDSHGVETVSCDLLDRQAVAELPKVDNVIFLAGRKFGTTGDVETTWAMNCLVPANCAEHYRGSRVVVFSTGCVYPLVPVASCGSVETDPPEPVGEYAQSCLGRERVWGHYSKTDGTPVVMFRLNYAVECRYGVLFDIAEQVLAGQPVQTGVGQFNCIWQGDVNNQALRCLEIAESPPSVINITGPETLGTRWAAHEMGRLMHREVGFAGDDGTRGYLSNATRATELFGYPTVPPRRVLQWVAHWMMQGGPGLGKPTHFEVTDGKY